MTPPFTPMRITPVSFVRNAVKKAFRKPPDEALSTIELIGIIVVVGVLSYFAVLGIGNLIDDAESNVAQSNLNTALQAVQAIGSDRLPDGGFSYTSTQPANWPAVVADQQEVDLTNAQVMIAALNRIVTNINFQPYNSGGSEHHIFNYNQVSSDPNVVYVAVNGEAIDHQNIPDIPAGHMARLVVQLTPETSYCAILVRSGREAGVGYDAWTQKDTGDNEAHEAHCLPRGNDGSNPLHGAAPLLYTTVAIGSDGETSPPGTWSTTTGSTFTGTCTGDGVPHADCTVFDGSTIPSSGLLDSQTAAENHAGTGGTFFNLSEWFFAITPDPARNHIALP